MEEISAWLDNPVSLDAGKSLYNQYAPRYRPNEVIAYQINIFSNSISRDLIIEELTAILDKLKEIHQPAGAPASMMFHKVGKNKNLPPDLAALDAGIPEIYKRRDYYRYAMRGTEPGDELRMLAYNAVMCDQEIRRRYKILDYFDRNGDYPPGFHNEPEDQTQIEKLTYWLQALKSYPRWITRNRNNDAKADELTRRMKVLSEINEFLEKNADHEA